MDYFDFIDSTFYAFSVKCPLLNDLLGKHYLFEINDEELVFGFAAKGDSFFGEYEESVKRAYPHYDSEDGDNFDFCHYLTNLLINHKNCGLIGSYDWRERLRMYDPDEQILYGDYQSEEEKLESDEIQEIINKLQENHDAINQSIETFCILVYEFMGECDNSSLDILSFKDGCYCQETLEESEINDLMESDCFNEDILRDECDLDGLLFTALHTYF